VTAHVLAEGLGVRFQFDRQGRPVTPAAARVRRRCSTTWALRGIDLELRPGDGVAVIGDNGAGKTTLLRTLAGVLSADEGRLQIRGRIGPLLANDAGLIHRLTGRESCHLLGVLAGLTRADARVVADQVRPAGALGVAFDRPVSTYSEGMRARLGFEVISRAGPRILLLDEVHEAVDHDFHGVIEARAGAIRESGGIVVAAGHDHEGLGRLCARAIHLDSGSLRAEGAFADVAGAYVRRQPAS
jgi:ABC-type polysaccharide/polyol phosphate transport system ATPase subunit